jgi:hypothetical protein
MHCHHPLCGYDRFHNNLSKCHKMMKSDEIVQQSVNCCQMLKSDENSSLTYFTHFHARQCDIQHWSRACHTIMPELRRIDINVQIA